MEVEIRCEIKEAYGNPKESFKKGVMSLVVLVSKCINPSFVLFKKLFNYSIKLLPLKTF